MQSFRATIIKIRTPNGSSYRRFPLLRRPLLRDVKLYSVSEEASGLLDRFWLARGVNDLAQRRRLVEVGVKEMNMGQTLMESPPSSSTVIPGAASAWFLDGDGSLAEDVVRVSHRLLALQRLFGDREDIDVVWIVQREPNLLTADMSLITQRLVTLITADGAAGVDVVKLIEAQPGLLLQEGGAISGSVPESSAQQQLAWSYGLLGDDDVQWSRRLNELEQYIAVHGDAHVGFRDGDDPELVRWAAKQREENSRGLLAAERKEKLQELDFEFDLERAEWLRWFNQLRAFKDIEGHCNPMPLAAGSDFLLLNWCAIQRIAKRSKVLPSDREALLEDIEFDWTGADALS